MEVAGESDAHTAPLTCTVGGQERARSSICATVWVRMPAASANGAAYMLTRSHPLPLPLVCKAGKIGDRWDKGMQV